MKKAPVTLVVLSVLLVLAAGAQAQDPLSFSKSFTPSTIGPGSVSTLRFNISNLTGAPAADVAFTDVLPAGMSIASPSNAFTSCGAGTVNAPNGGDTISLSSGSLGASSSCIVRVDVTSSTPGTLTNTSGTLTSSIGNGGTATASLTVATDRPGFTKAFSPSTVAFGGRSTLTFTLDNTANSSEVVSINFTDTLPGGMVVASPANRSTTCGGTQFGTGTFTAAAGSSTVSVSGFFPVSFAVPAGSSCTFSVDVAGNSVGLLGNTSGELTSATTSSPQTRSSGKAGAVLTVTNDRILLTKSFTDDPVSPGGIVNLQFSITNLDRNDSATNISFSDNLGAVISGMAAVAPLPGNPCGAGSSLSGSSNVTLNGGNLAVGETCTFNVSVQVPGSAALGTYVNTTSQISGDIGGRPVTANPATDLLFVQAVPTLTKTFLDNPAGAGGTTELMFTLTAASGTPTITDVAFSDVFDAIIPSAVSFPSGGFCGPNSSATFTPRIDGTSVIPAQFNVMGAGLDGGTSCSFSIVLNIEAGTPAGIYPNETTGVTGISNGQAVEGNPATDDLEIVAPPALAKQFTNDPVDPGETVTLEFTLSHDELAAGAASNVAFTDDLDAALSGLVAVAPLPIDPCGVGSAISGTSVLSFSGGSLAPGESCTFSVTLSVPATAASGSFTNSTSPVTASVQGVSTTGLAASDALLITGLVLTKEFLDDPIIPGDTVVLEFALSNDSPVSTATDIVFSDDFGDMLPGTSIVSLPMGEVCGTGSSLIAQGDRVILVGGNLGPGEVCVFSVTLQVPAGTDSATYFNTTSEVSAMIDGSTVLFDPALDDLIVSEDFLELAKAFIDDPVSPGDPVTLRFTIDNLSLSDPVTNIAFSDLLDNALSGLVSTSGTLTDVCGTGSQISGTSGLTFSGGSLAAGATCTFDVTLQVPSSAPLGTTATNVTSEITGLIGGLDVRGNPATDDLLLNALDFNKSFAGPVFIGETVELTFTIENLSTTDGFADLGFTDDLDAVLPGLLSISGTQANVCGTGSELSGLSLLILSGANLGPGETCTFSVTVQVPASAAVGSYVNVTSDLIQNGLSVAPPAVASLEVEEFVEVDSDGDGVLDGDDLCPGTVIPENVPTKKLGVNRYALVDGDLVFDTTSPPGKGGGPGDVFTTTDTAGCSCEQIIDALDLGNGHVFNGCSIGAMRDWVDLVN